VPDYVSLLGEDLRGVRLGVPRAGFFEQCHPDVLAAVRTAIDTLCNLGATAVDVDLPFVEYGYAAQWTISYSEAYAYHRSNFFSRRRDYGDRFLHKIASGAFLDAEELVTAQRLRTAITYGFLAALQNVDVIVAPSTGYPANPVDGAYGGGDQAHLTRPVSLTSLPALSAPAGFTATGLPVGLQVVGRAWEESLVLRVGHAYQQATDWHRREPPLMSFPPDTTAAAPAMTDSRFDAAWILDYARLHGLSFVEESDAGAIAASTAPAKKARGQLDSGLEPATRAAPSPLIR
jgi:aspartyl-tRNA(Asn)/glutamyl-tRNA(Gln) amidotransferase subunit A